MSTFGQCTVVEHTSGDSPEQVASDLLVAAFTALSAVRARDASQSKYLADAQAHVAEAVVELNRAWPLPTS